MSDPIAASARAAARALSGELGPQRVGDVESLIAAGGYELQPRQYVLDPITLGSLILAAARLAWTVYTDLKRKTPAPAPVERHVRVQLRDAHSAAPAQQDRIIEVVVSEVIRHADPAA